MVCQLENVIFRFCPNAKLKIEKDNFKIHGENYVLTALSSNSQIPYLLKNFKNIEFSHDFGIIALSKWKRTSKMNFCRVYHIQFHMYLLAAP